MKVNSTAKQLVDSTNCRHAYCLRCATIGDRTSKVRNPIIVTPRQYKVAELIARDLTNKEIADILGTSKSTIANLSVRLFERTGVKRTGTGILFATGQLISANTRFRKVST